MRETVRQPDRGQVEIANLLICRSTHSPPPPPASRAAFPIQLLNHVQTTTTTSLDCNHSLVNLVETFFLRQKAAVGLLLPFTVGFFAHLFEPAFVFFIFNRQPDHGDYPSRRAAYQNPTNQRDAHSAPPALFLFSSSERTKSAKT